MQRNAPLTQISLFFIAIGLPWQLAYEWAPNHSYVNELLAFLGWALLLLFVEVPKSVPLSFRLKSFLGALGLLGVVGLLQWASGHTQQPAQVVHLMFYLFAAGLVTVTAYQLQARQDFHTVLDYWSWAWIIGLILGFAVAICQEFQWGLDGTFLAQLTEPGRISGNIRQPNHFATLMVLGLPCIAWLLQGQSLSNISASLLTIAVAMVVIMTGSRTGQLELVWAGLCLLLDRKTRALAGVLAFASVCAYFLLWWADANHLLHFFSAHKPSLEQLASSSIQESRWPLWKDTVSLILQNPITGTGFGQFQFYALLSDLPVPFTRLYGNAHSLPLQLAVEFGLPVTSAFFILIFMALRAPASNARTASGLFAITCLGALFIHSMLEFPLWYSYFLLPFCFYVGVWIGQSKQETVDQPLSSLLATKVQTRSYNRPAAIFILLSALISAAHYLAPASMYNLAAPFDNFQDNLKTARRAFLYNNLVMLYSVGVMPYADVDAYSGLLPFIAREVRFYADAGVLAKYALVLSNNGRYDLAKRVIYSARQLDPNVFLPLELLCKVKPSPEHDRFLTLLRNPTPPSVSARDFP